MLRLRNFEACSGAISPDSQTVDSCPHQICCADYHFRRGFYTVETSPMLGSTGVEKPAKIKKVKTRIFWWLWGKSMGILTPG